MKLQISYYTVYITLCPQASLKLHIMPKVAAYHQSEHGRFCTGREWGENGNITVTFHADFPLSLQKDHQMAEFKTLVSPWPVVVGVQAEYPVRFCTVRFVFNTNVKAYLLWNVWEYPTSLGKHRCKVYAFNITKVSV